MYIFLFGSSGEMKKRQPQLGHSSIVRMNAIPCSSVFLLSIFLVVTVAVTRKDANSVIHTLKVLGPQKIGPSEKCAEVL